MWCLTEQVKANMSTKEVMCTWPNVEWWSWRHIIAARISITERLRPLCTDYFNNMRPVHNTASDEQITSKKVWREQKKWILKHGANAIRSRMSKNRLRTFGTEECSWRHFDCALHWSQVLSHTLYPRHPELNVLNSGSAAVRCVILKNFFVRSIYK